MKDPTPACPAITYHLESVRSVLVNQNLPNTPIFVVVGVTELLDKLNLGVCGRRKRTRLGSWNVRKRLARVGQIRKIGHGGAVLVPPLGGSVSKLSW
jgi:hypothetical protein